MDAAAQERIIVKNPTDGTGIPLQEVEALARILLPQIQAFLESEEGQKEFAEWKERQKANYTTIE